MLEENRTGGFRQRTVARERASPISEYQLEISLKNDHKVTKEDVCGNLRFCLVNWSYFYSMRKTFGVKDCF